MRLFSIIAFFVLVVSFFFPSPSKSVAAEANLIVPVLAADLEQEIIGKKLIKGDIPSKQLSLQESFKKWKKKNGHVLIVHYRAPYYYTSQALVMFVRCPRADLYTSAPVCPKQEVHKKQSFNLYPTLRKHEPPASPWRIFTN